MIFRVFACSLLLVLPSCIPTLRGARPGPGLPPFYEPPANPAADAGGVATTRITTAENAAELGIAQFFDDPTLTHLIDQALAGNQELRILNEEIEIARNEILLRRGAYLPAVTFGAKAGLDKHSLYTPEGAVVENLEFEPDKFFPDPLPDFVLGFNAFMPLDIWREFRNARDAARQRFCAAIEKRNYFVTELVAEIAEKYYTLMALDKRMETLDQTIELQEQSLEISIAKKDAGRGTELAVQRFQAEVRKNRSEKLIVSQEMIESENRINFLVNRYPQPVERASARFYNLNVSTLGIGVPAQLLRNRPDIRQAERELAAAGLDVKVARARFFPRIDLTAGVGYRAFNPKYLFITPEALIYNVASDIVAPVINRAAIKAEYMSANARQLQAVYNYQQVILEAFTEVINRVSKVENYSQSIEIKKQQLEALEGSVETASKLFQNARAEYVEVLLAQRDLQEARMVLIETKKEQLSAVVYAYQALGGGNALANGSGPGHCAPAGGWPLAAPSDGGAPIDEKRGLQSRPGKSNSREDTPLPIPPGPELPPAPQGRATVK